MALVREPASFDVRNHPPQPSPGVPGEGVIEEDFHMVATAYPRKFVPADLKLQSFADVEPLYRELLDRPIASPAELERWLANFSELASVVAEVGTRRYIAKSCHTDDPAIEKTYMQFVEEIEPRV